MLAPDIAGWRAERLTPMPKTAYIETPPDWICEVLSPSTQAIDRTDKLAVYAESGVKHCWYVDPLARTLEVLALTGGKWLLAATFKNDDAVAALGQLPPRPERDALRAAVDFVVRRVR